MTQQKPPFSMPPVNFWDGNTFVVPGYTQGYDLPPVAPPPVTAIPAVLPPILPPAFSAGLPQIYSQNYPRENFAEFGPRQGWRPMGLLDMNYVKR